MAGAGYLARARGQGGAAYAAVVGRTPSGESSDHRVRFCLPGWTAKKMAAAQAPLGQAKARSAAQQPPECGFWGRATARHTPAGKPRQLNYRFFVGALKYIKFTMSQIGLFLQKKTRRDRQFFVL